MNILAAATTLPLVFACNFDRPISASLEGQEICSSLSRTAKHMRSSVTFGYGDELEARFSDLRHLASEVLTDNWDGYSARALPVDAFQAAAKFLEALPKNFPMPELGASRLGDVTFEWFQSPRRVVSAGISAEGLLHYASLNGAERIFGSFPFRGSISTKFLGLVEAVLG